MDQLNQKILELQWPVRGTRIFLRAELDSQACKAVRTVGSHCGVLNLPNVTRDPKLSLCKIQSVDGGRQTTEGSQMASEAPTPIFSIPRLWAATSGAIKFFPCVVPTSPTPSVPQFPHSDSLCQRSFSSEPPADPGHTKTRPSKLKSSEDPNKPQVSHAAWT